MLSVVVVSFCICSGLVIGRDLGFAHSMGQKAHLNVYKINTINNAGEKNPSKQHQKRLQMAKFRVRCACVRKHANATEKINKMRQTQKIERKKIVCYHVCELFGLFSFGRVTAQSFACNHFVDQSTDAF